MTNTHFGRDFRRSSFRRVERMTTIHVRETLYCSWLSQYSYRVHLRPVFLIYIRIVIGKKTAKTLDGWKNRSSGYYVYYYYCGKCLCRARYTRRREKTQTRTAATAAAKTGGVPIYDGWSLARRKKKSTGDLNIEKKNTDVLLERRKHNIIRTCVHVWACTCVCVCVYTLKTRLTCVNAYNIYNMKLYR